MFLENNSKKMTNLRFTLKFNQIVTSTKNSEKPNISII